MEMVEIFSGPTYQASILKTALENEGIPVMVQPTGPFAAVVADVAQPPFQRLLVSQEAYDLQRDVIERCLDLVGGDESVSNLEEQSVAAGEPDADSQPEKPTEGPLELVDLFSGPRYEADMLREALDREGIPSDLEPAGPVATVFSEGAVGAVFHVLVSRKEYESRRDAIDRCLALFSTTAEDDSGQDAPG